MPPIWTLDLAAERLIVAHRGVSSGPVLSDGGRFTVAGRALGDVLAVIG